MTSHVRSTIEELQPRGRVVDLFSGMGSVAESLQDSFPIVTNDAFAFVAVIARARFTGTARTTMIATVLDRLRHAYLNQFDYLSERFAQQICDERLAISLGKDALATYMTQVRHVGNDRSVSESARIASNDPSHQKYCLTCLYFSGGYFSILQAIEIDALRYAIDTIGLPDESDWLIGAWLVALSALVNAPGHTAQFLKPSSEAGFSRIVSAWKRSVWRQFEPALDSMRQIGSDDWRAQNDVFVGDALDLIGSQCLDQVGAFYADPPYTKDQYSRFYHVYETLYRYDFPDASGAGRTRSDRFTTGFSLKTMVVASFHELCRSIARRGVPLVLSYPSHGLLDDVGWSLQDITSTYFHDVSVKAIDARHSTMGASKGMSRKHVTEHLYVCRP